jgi:hypothetical protein
VHLVDRPPRPPRRAAALVALLLGLIGSPVFAQTSPAIDLLHRASSSRARARAAEALGRLRPAGARAALEAALDDRSSSVRVASAQALEALGDPAATAALDRHTLDRDARARQAVLHARMALQRQPRIATASDWITTPRAPAPAPTSAPAPAPATAAAPATIDWRRVRVLITLGSLVNRASTDATHVAQLREALRVAVGQDERYAIHPGSLPSSVASRLRHGELRAYSLEGTLGSLRSGEAGGPNVSVRAEVSLVLVAEPSHSIAATLSGTATAQEARLAIPNQPDPMPRLRQRAIEGAARGAMRSLQTQLLAQRDR